MRDFDVSALLKKRFFDPQSRALCLRGHTGKVLCLTVIVKTIRRGRARALDSCLLASGGEDKSIIIWRLTDGALLGKLNGHTQQVRCLAPLTCDRVASGSDDTCVIIWQITDGAQLAKLERHTRPVLCLAALGRGVDGIASGSSDNSIIVWSLADGARLHELGGRRELAKLNEHTSHVRCLVELQRGRLASGSSDKTVIIWNLTDGTQLAKLEGHTRPVSCLAALGPRLASSDGSSTIIWNAADGVFSSDTPFVTLGGGGRWLTPFSGGRLASLFGFGKVIVWDTTDRVVDKPDVVLNSQPEVCCLAALEDGRLVQGCKNGTIHIHPVLHSAAYKVTMCGSAFEFEEVARACGEHDRLGDLIDAVAMNAVNREFMKETSDPPLFEEVRWYPSAAITTGAHAFDAIARVLEEEQDPSKLIDEVVPSVLALVNDESLLPEMKRRGVSRVAIEQLAPTKLFSVVLDAKYSAGPRFVLYGEILLFLGLMFCFGRIAGLEFLAWPKWYGAERIVLLFFGFAILAWFSVREVGQMISARAIELAELEDPLSAWKVEKGQRSKPKGLTYYALLIPRCFVLYLVCVPLLLVLLVAERLRLSERERVLKRRLSWTEPADLMKDLRRDSDGPHTTIAEYIYHDPLTFLGMPRAWRRDYWSWIDVVTLVFAWASFVRAAMPGKRLSVNLAAVACILLGIKLLQFVKSVHLKCATFVLMMERLVGDLKFFVVFFLYIMVVFAFTFYLYLGPRRNNDDGYESWPKTLFSLFVLAFTGEFDSDIFSTDALKVLLSVFIVVAVLVQLNVLIAIVSESYDRAETVAKSLFYRSRLELIVETDSVVKRLPLWARVADDEDSIKERLKDKLRQQDDSSDEMGRINETVRRTRTEVQVDTQRALHESEERTKEELAAVKRELAIVTATQQTILEKLEALLEQSSPSSDELAPS